jgi:uncharacterized protein
MKYLLVVAFVLVVFWMWRSGRDQSRSSMPSPEPRKRELTEVVACDYCHVHLPRSEALIGKSGTFCSDAHRQEAGA